MKSATTLKKADPKKDGTDEGFEVLSSAECDLAPAVGKDSGLLVQLETDLLTQLKVSKDSNFSNLSNLQSISFFLTSGVYSEQRTL